MTSEQQAFLNKELKFAGFSDHFKSQLQEQGALGITEPKLSRMEYHQRGPKDQTVIDRAIYRPSVKIGTEHAFYNGFEVWIIKNMPTEWVKNGVDLKELELRLSDPPKPNPATGTTDPAYQQALATYQDDLKKDLTRMYNADQRMFTKVAAAYWPIVEHLLLPERRQQVKDIINTTLDGDIRKQWFPKKDRITKQEAFNLIDDDKKPRAIYKQVKVNEAEGTEGASVDEKPAVVTKGRWLMLDYEKPMTQHFNRVYHTYDDAYKFDQRADIRRFNIQGIDTEDGLNALAKLIEKGHRVAVVPLDQSEHKLLFIYANVPYKTHTLEDIRGEYVPHEKYLTQQGRQQRDERQPVRYEAKPFQIASRPFDPENEKKKVTHTPG
jgi:hypothetical protein